MTNLYKFYFLCQTHTKMPWTQRDTFFSLVKNFPFEKQEKEKRQYVSFDI